MQVSLIEFSVENYKIFKEKATFSMLARKNDEHAFKSNGENLLKTSLIYGPNASGKTTILDAFEILRKIIFFSANLQENPELPYQPFLASEETVSKPVLFDVVYSIDDKVIRYTISFVREHIVTERMATILKNGNEKEYFSRSNQDIQLGSIFEDLKNAKENTRKESLFLSTMALLNDDLGKEMLDAFRNINVISGIHSGAYRNFTVKKFKEDADYRKKILRYLKMADFCVSGGRTQEIDVQNISIINDSKGFSATPQLIKSDIMFFKHPIYNSKNEKTGTFELSFDEESIGTQKFFDTLGPIIDTLDSGKTLLIDEFDNSLHPLLTKFIVNLFQSEKTNTHNAQLIVTTHDTSLLSYKEDFIKDQFWFTEKDEFGSAKLFSLAEFAMRNDTEYAKKYLEGRFGALPFIESINK